MHLLNATEKKADPLYQ